MVSVKREDSFGGASAGQNIFRFWQITTVIGQRDILGELAIAFYDAVPHNGDTTYGFRIGT